MTNKKTGKSARLIYFTQCNKVSKPPYHHIPLYPNLSQISHPPCLFISLGFSQLAERYATPLPTLTKELATLSARVDEHLKKMGAVWN